MADKKTVDLRNVTHGGGVIRIEVWQDASTGIVFATILLTLTVT